MDANPDCVACTSNVYWEGARDEFYRKYSPGEIAVDERGVVTDFLAMRQIHRCFPQISALALRQGDPGNFNSPFNELPSRDATGPIDVPKDLVMVSRVAMQMGVAKPAAKVGPVTRAGQKPVTIPGSQP